MKWFLRISFGLFILFVLVVGALFLPFVQKTIVINTLSKQYGTVTVDTFSGGLNGLRVSNLQIENEDFSAQIPELELTTSIVGLLFGDEILIDELTLNKGSLDFSQVTDWDSFSLKYFGESEETPFTGIFSQLNEVKAIGLQNSAIDLEVLLPEDQAVTLSINNRSKNIWSPALELQVQAINSSSNESLLTLNGLLNLSSNKDKKLNALAFAGEIDTPQNKVDLNLEANWDEKRENYKITLHLPQSGTPIFASETEYLYESDALSGTYLVDLESKQLPPFQFLNQFPSFAIEGNGKYKISPNEETFTIDSNLTGELLDFSNLSSQLTALNQSVIDLKIATSGTPQAVILKEINGLYRTNQGEDLVNLTLSPDIALRPTDEGWSPEIKDKWGQLTISNLPLDLFAPLLEDKGIEIDNGTLAGRLEITSNKNRIVLNSIAPIVLSIDTPRLNKQVLAKQVDLRIKTKASATFSGKSPRLDELQILSSVDRAALSVSTRQALPLDKGLLLPDGELAQIRIQNLDLSSIDPFIPDIRLSGKITEQSFNIDKDGANWILYSPTVGNIQIGSLQGNGQPILSETNIRLQPKLLYDGKKIAYQTGAFSLASRTGKFLSIESEGELSLFSLLAGNPTGKVSGKAEVNLIHANRQPFFLNNSPIRGGKAHASFAANWAKEKSLSVEIDGERIVLKDAGFQTIDKLFLNADATQKSPNNWSIQSPIILKTRNGESNLSLLSDINTTKSGIQFQANLTGKELIVDDFLLLAGGFSSNQDKDNEAIQTEEEPAPPWHGLNGQLTIKLDRFTYLQNKLFLKNFIHQLTLSDEGIQENTSLSNLYGGELKTSSTLKENTSNRFSLQSDFQLKNVDAKTMFSSLQGNPTQVFSGNLSGVGKVNSVAESFDMLVDNLKWDVDLQANDGDLKILSALTEQLPFGNSRQARGIQQGLGVIGGILGNTQFGGSESKRLQDIQLILKAATLLGSLPYDRLDLNLQKKKSDSPLLVKAQAQGSLFQMALEGEIAQEEETSFSKQPLSLVMDLGAESDLKAILARLKLLEEASSSSNQGYVRLKEPIVFQGTLQKLIYQDFVGKLISSVTGLNFNDRSNSPASAKEPPPSETEELIRGASGLLDLLSP